MSLIGKIFAGLGEIVISFATFLGNLFNQAITLFYDGDDLTSLGFIMLIGLGTGLLMWGFNFLRKFIRIRRG